MSNDNNDEENIELQERIMSIKNIGYFVYTWHRRIIICTALTAIVGMFAIAFLGEWYNTKLIALGGFLGLAVIIISIALLHIFYRKQYFIENENGKTILVVGGFRRFRKYYVNNRCYKIKKGQAIKIKYKKRDSIKTLFSAMKKAEIVKNELGNKEVFSIKQKNKEDALSLALGGGLPAKYGEMIFIDGKFKNGFYTSTSTMSYALHFRVAKDNVKCKDIVPHSILKLIE